MHLVKERFGYKLCYEMDNILATTHTTYVSYVRYTYGFVSMNCGHIQRFTMMDRVN